MQHALTLIFVETKKGADALEHWLCMNGFPATAIHGDKVQMVSQLCVLFIVICIFYAFDVLSLNWMASCILCLDSYLPGFPDLFIHMIYTPPQISVIKGKRPIEAQKPVGAPCRSKVHIIDIQKKNIIYVR